MASIIRVKRSTGTTAPGSLQFGELGLTIGTGTQANKGERLFVGDNSGNVDVVGGRYFTDLMVHAPGTVASVTNPTTAANGFVAILDQNRKVDLWNVDNLTLDGNTFSSTNTNGDINIDPNGSGEIVIPDDTFLTFGTGKDSKIEYDENGSDQLKVTGADVNIDITTQSTSSTTGALIVDGGVGIAKDLNVGGTTQSNSKDTGAFVIEGGVGIEKNLNVGGNINIVGIVTFNDHIKLPDSKELRFGDSNDLVIEHDGSHSRIKDTGTGNLNIQASVAAIQNAAGTENCAVFNQNGSVELYFDNAKKLATRIDGVEVTGTTDTDNLVVSGVATVASAKISDLTSGRVVLAGTAGELEDSGNLTFNGTKLTVTGNAQITSDLDVDGGANISGGETVLSSATVSDLTNNRLVIVGASGALEDDANLTFDGSQLSVVGIITHVGKMVNTGGIEIDSVGISSNIIATRNGAGDQLFIDPFPSGGSNEGTVIIKGDLQVDGTTTTVNSTTATVNDPIMRVGDVTSIRTVMSPVSSGANTIVVDSVTGLATDDIISATGIPGNTTISSINTGTKTLTISNNTTAGITTSTQLTITHAKDTNTDRGISFNYNTSSGTANNKLGFFGMDDSQVGANGSRVWTYVPEATNTAEVISGTKGYLDIKGIYYQSGDFSTHGITYFDSTGLQNSTTAPSAATFTSTQLLTAVTEIAITLGSAQSVVAGDLVTQAGGGSQQGVVKSTSNSTTVTLIGVTGTFNTSADLILNGTGTGKTPTNVSTTYTSKPMWTTTIDGGTF